MPNEPMDAMDTASRSAVMSSIGVAIEGNSSLQSRHRDMLGYLVRAHQRLLHYANDPSLAGTNAVADAHAQVRRALAEAHTHEANLAVTHNYTPPEQHTAVNVHAALAQVSGYSSSRPPQAARLPRGMEDDSDLEDYSEEIEKAKQRESMRNEPRRPATNWQAEARSMDATDKLISRTEANGIHFVRRSDHYNDHAAIDAIKLDEHGNGTVVGTHAWSPSSGETTMLSVHPDYKGAGLVHGLLKNSIDFNSRINGAPLVGSKSITEDSAKIMRTYFPEMRKKIRATLAYGIDHNTRHLDPDESYAQIYACKTCGGEGLVRADEAAVRKAVGTTIPQYTELGEQLFRQAQRSVGRIDCPSCGGSGRA